MSANRESKWKQRQRAIASLGLLPSVVYKLQRLRCAYTNVRRPFVLTSRYAEFPLSCRPNSSDIDVFNQIFVGREYRCLDDVGSAGLIVDCGANVGYSSAYFLTRFPGSFLVAVEPDQDNFALLDKNLAPYGGRYRAVCSAVWSHSVGLVVSENAFGDGREWSRSVREARQGEAATMTGIDIGTLLRESGRERISILKIDIEGAEAAVFSSGCETWLDKVDNLVIELHGDECRSVFEKAIAGLPFRVSQCDELTVCQRVPA